MLAKIATMTVTTMSSIKVKPDERARPLARECKKRMEKKSLIKNADACLMA
jgi:hypothetical protein